MDSSCAVKAERTWLWSLWLCCAKPTASNPQDPPRELTSPREWEQRREESVKSVEKLKGCDSLLLLRGRWDLALLQTRSWEWQQISVTLGGLRSKSCMQLVCKWVCFRGVVGSVWRYESILPLPVTPMMGPSIVQCFTGFSPRYFDLSYQAKLIKVCSKVILHHSFSRGADNQVSFIYLFVNKAVQQRISSFQQYWM